MKKNWFMLSNGMDARTVENYSSEAEDAIMDASASCQYIEKQLNQCYLALLKIFGSKKHGFSAINKTNILERDNQLKTFLQDNYYLFRSEKDLKEALKTQHNLGGRLNSMDNIFAEEFGWKKPEGYEVPTYMVRMVLAENEKRCKEEGIKRPSRIHPDGSPNNTTWSRMAVALWFKNGGYFKKTEDQIKWLSWIRGSETVKCEVCGKRSAIQLHHKDEDHFNNFPTNHAIVCSSCHKNIHDGEVEHTVPELKY